MSKDRRRRKNRPRTRGGQTKAAKAKKAAAKVDTGWKLCIATDGEVIVAERTPDFDEWIPVLVKPWLTREDALKIRDAICDHYPNELGADPDEVGRWLFRSDPKSQIDLLRQFRATVEREAAKRTA
jgi:hypothetical protein